MATRIKRFATEKLTSVEDDLLSFIEGVVASAINGNAMFIPNPFDKVVGVFLTPMKNGSVSANGVALFTTAVGYQIETDSAVVGDLPAWAVSTNYYEGQMVRNSGKAYVCKEDHNSGSSFNSSKFEEVPETKFIRISHTAAGSGKIANCLYLVTGYKL